MNVGSESRRRALGRWPILGAALIALMVLSNQQAWSQGACGVRGNYYNGRRKTADGPFTGGAADVETYKARLCTGSTTGSAAWVGVGMQQHFVQVGYYHGLDPIRYQYYYEFNVPGGWNNYSAGLPDPGYVHFKVERTGNQQRWVVWIGGTSISGPVNNQQPCHGDRVTWTAETLHPETYCVGDPGNPVGYHYCKYKDKSAWSACPGPGGWSRYPAAPPADYKQSPTEPPPNPNNYFYIWDQRSPGPAP